MSLIPRHSLFDFDSLFDTFWVPQRQSEAGEETTSFLPRVDVKEKKSSYEITAELPGIEKDDVHVHLDDGVLSIEAEHKYDDKEEKDGKVIRQERRYGKFMRSFNLGRDVTESDVKAEFKNGVLKLEVPKVEVNEPETTVRRIPIK